MSVFTSKRERRLWLLTAVTVLAIYSTLGLAGSLAEYLSERELIEMTWILGLLLLVAVTVGTGISRRPVRREILVMLGVATVYGMVLVRSGIGGAERTHLFEYGLIAILIYEALIERHRHRPLPLPSWAMAIVATALLGLVDETIQAALPNRVYALVGVGFNALAGFMAVSARQSLAWARRRTHALDDDDP